MNLLPKNREHVLRIPLTFTDEVVDRPELAWIATATALCVRQYEPVQCRNKGLALIDARQNRAQQLSEIPKCGE